MVQINQTFLRFLDFVLRNHTAESMFSVLEEARVEKYILIWYVSFPSLFSVWFLAWLRAQLLLQLAFGIHAPHMAYKGFLSSPSGPIGDALL